MSGKRIMADFVREQQKLLRKQEGKLYRCRFCRIPILACQCLLPLLIGGVIFYCLLQDVELLEKAAACYIFFLPFTIVCCIINRFAGSILAVLGKDGFYAVKGMGGSAQIRLEKALVYIPYQQIEKIFYGDFFLEVTYRQTEEAADGKRTDTCTIVCPLWRIVSKDFARKLSRKTSGAVLAEGQTAEDIFLPLLLATGYVILYASYIRDFTERVLMKGW